MSEMTLSFQPLLPWGLLLLALLPFALMGLSKRGRPRLFLLLALALVLSGPTHEQKELKTLDDVVLVVRDDSRSNQLPERQKRTDKAYQELLESLSLFGDVDVREVATTDSPRRGSDVFNQMRGHVESINPDRLSAIFVLSDGEINDLPQSSQLNLPAPTYLLRTTKENSYDRKLIVREAPSYGIVDKELTLRVFVEDSQESTTELTIAHDQSQTQRSSERTITIPTGEEVVIPFTLSHGGVSALHLSVPKAETETITQNNQFTSLVTGIREDLDVLLVSGKPHSGTRMLRGLLKSDPAINLVHFTILRSMTDIDPAPRDELALIPFPVRELFEERLYDFDLVIFDRYNTQSFINPSYFDNMVRYVNEGGAMMVLAGPEFGQQSGIDQTALADIFPVRPDRLNLQTPYRPTLTNLGRRHPVTAPLTDAENNWGALAHIIPGLKKAGQTLMADESDNPLLVLNRTGDGRVGLWLSDQLWFWAKGIDGGGPYLDLLKRSVHWLMKEPELEEEQLRGRIEDGQLHITYFTAAERGPLQVDIETPLGDTQTVTLTPEKDFKTTLPTASDGLYTLTSAEGHRTYALENVLRDMEWQAQHSQRTIDSAFTETGGAVYHTTGDIPSLRRVSDNGRHHGKGWIGLPKKQQHEIVGAESKPLFSPLAGLLIIGLTLLGVWFYESRRS